MQDSNSNLVKISEILSDGEYHDGTSLGDQCGITRAAVWKVIKKLEHYGVEITSVKGKGYLLASPLLLLDKVKIKKDINNAAIEIDILEKIGSTNDYLKNENADRKIKICIAEMQTQGRGRLNRQWHSPFGQNIYFSMRNSFQKDMSELSGLSLVAGLSVARAIESVTELHTLQLKWPNDILVNHQKVAGVLIDIQAESNGFCHVIIGVGINVNMQEANKKLINQPWNSLRKITGHYIDRNLLCAALIKNLVNDLEQFSNTGLSDFLDEWKQKDYLFNKSIQLMSGQNKLAGLGAGINSLGHLILRFPDQTTRTFSSGDTTLLK